MFPLELFGFLKEMSRVEQLPFLTIAYSYVRICGAVFPLEILLLSARASDSLSLPFFTRTDYLAYGNDLIRAAAFP